MCDCYQIGGPFIAEDPDCPIHGSASKGRDDRIASIVQRAIDGEITAEQAAIAIDELYY